MKSKFFTLHQGEPYANQVLGSRSYVKNLTIRILYNNRRKMSSTFA